MSSVTPGQLGMPPTDARSSRSRKTTPPAIHIAATTGG
jgi:hypothetical protein